MNKARGTKFASFTKLMQCFNIAAICALAVWHAYAFYVHRLTAQEVHPAAPVFEFQPVPVQHQNASRSSV